MSTVTRPPLKPFHIVCFEGALRCIGKGNVTFRPGVDEVFWFDTQLEQEQHVLVRNDRNKVNNEVTIQQKVELPKNPLAYAAMRQDAMDWVRLPEPRQWDPKHYPALAITVDVYNVDPTQAAQLIIDAVERDVLSVERQRTIDRKRLKEK